MRGFPEVTFPTLLLEGGLSVPDLGPGSRPRMLYHPVKPRSCHEPLSDRLPAAFVRDHVR